MNIQQIGILSIIKSALLGESYTLPEGFDIVAAAKLAHRHQITALFYYGALNCGVSAKLYVMQKLFVKTCELTATSEKQMYEINELLARFDENKIDYLPLKGVNLKKLYAKTELRIMSDADILIRTEQYDKIKLIMQASGYTEQYESDHELVWEKQGVHIELHKRLIPSYNKDYYSYFGDGWRLGTPVSEESTCYAMSREDEMIYLFTHFAKHYRDAGIGLKHIVDLWVFEKNVETLNKKYILQELEKLQLKEFYENVMRTISVCFEGAESDDVCEVLINTIFDSGVYGTHEAHILSDTVKISKSMEKAKKIRNDKLLELVFLPYKQMCAKYPILEKAPVLLPIMWIVRFFTALIFKRDKVKKHNNDLKTMSAEKIENYQQALNFVGLDFNFKE